MKIAVVETAPYGGLLHYAFQLADALGRRGDDVDLIVPRDNELAGRPSAARTLAVLTPPVRTRGGPPPRRVVFLLRKLLVGFRLVRSWLRVIRLTRKGGYDAVVINPGIQAVVVAALAELANRLPGGPPMVHICHDVRPFSKSSGRLFRSGGMLNRRLGAAYASYDLMLVHGDASRREYEQTWKARRLAVIPHGDERIFAGEPPAPSNEERVLFFGNWQVVKGIPVLMQAFDLLLERRPTARLTLAGSPNPQEVDVAAIRSWAAGRPEIDLSEGYVPLEDVPAVFARARVVALPYLVAFQSGIIHLAMTMGRAVVASDVGDLGAAVADGETGLLVPPDDPEALASALERIVADPSLAERFGAEGRRRVLSDSSWETVAERLEAELRELA